MSVLHLFRRHTRHPARHKGILNPRLHSERDNIMSSDVTLGIFVKLSNVHLFGASPSTTTLFRRRSYAPLTRVAIRAGHRRTPLCGGRLGCRAVAPLRVVKMRRRSFTPRFASKTIRSLAHFHDAGDEGDALVVIRRHSHRLQVAAIRGPRRKYFRWGKDLRPRKLDG